MSGWLFYSERCPHSKKFIEEISKLPMVAKKISMVEIEKNVDRLPPFLQSVPTLQYDKEIIVGDDLMVWLKKEADNSLEPAPMVNSKGGLNVNPYSSFNENGGEGVFKNFTMIGDKNGSEGMEDLANDIPTDSASMEQLESKRQVDIRDLMC